MLQCNKKNGSVVAQSDGFVVCYLCKNDPAATILNPTALIDFSPVGAPTTTSLCGDLFDAGINGTIFLQDECLAFQNDTEFQSICGCSNFMASPTTTTALPTEIQAITTVPSLIAPSPSTMGSTNVPTRIVFDTPSAATTTSTTTMPTLLTTQDTVVPTLLYSQPDGDSNSSSKGGSKMMMMDKKSSKGKGKMMMSEKGKMSSKKDGKGGDKKKMMKRKKKSSSKANDGDGAPTMEPTFPPSFEVVDTPDDNNNNDPSLLLSMVDNNNQQQQQPMQDTINVNNVSNSTGNVTEIINRIRSTNDRV